MEITENNLLSSENNFENSNTNDLNNQLSVFFKQKSLILGDSSKHQTKRPNKKNDQDLLNLIESSSFELSNLTISNEITNGIRDFEFEAGIEKLTLLNSEEYNFRNLRKKSHAQIVIACAHATYFVGIANRIRRNIDEIKSGAMKQKNSMLLNEMKRTPGLHIGIIGCGKLGRQLARCFLEYAEVYPNELHISTRQPELLSEFVNKNVKCYYDNRRLVNSVNIIFICVLPNQLELVINDIKKSMPEKCIIYSLVRPVNGMHLKNLFHNCISKSFIVRPEYQFTNKLYDPMFKWNYSLDIIESLGESEMIAEINPFNHEEKLITTGNYTKATFVYSLINICSFLSLTKKETLNALRNFVFFSINKNFKLDENHFYDIKNQSLHLPIVDLVETSNNPTAFSAKLELSKSFKRSLGKNFLNYFEEANAWRARKSLKS